MKKELILFFGCMLFALAASAQFSVSADRHNILKAGKPFFWLGDTAWELFHRLSREEADHYLKTRKDQGFTVIQAVVLAELDGLNTGNAYGDKPLLDNDPARPNEAYFKHVDHIIRKAASYGLNIALLPTWGDKVNKSSWGKGPEIFNEENAAVFGAWLANRYRKKKNIIWVLGGDRNPRNASDIAIWNSMARSIMKSTKGKALISFHSQPNEKGSAEWFNDQNWFAFNMFQNGHCRDQPVYQKILASYQGKPTRPVLDAEPLYEDHPICFNAKELGTSTAYDVRKFAYLDLFSGAFGHTYGCHDIWQMYSPAHPGVNGPHHYWKEALLLPGALQMQYVRRLMESHPPLDRVPDQSLIKERDLPPAKRIQALRGKDYLYVYTARGNLFTLLPGKIKGDRLKAFWFDPRTGAVSEAGSVDNHQENRFEPPSSGEGQDWVLVAQDEQSKYKL